jgi:hypothetical protein
MSGSNPKTELKGNKVVRSPQQGKMTLTKFLRLHPQNPGVAAILRSRYGQQLKTEAEWLAVVESLLNERT